MGNLVHFRGFGEKSKLFNMDIFRGEKKTTKSYFFGFLLLLLKSSKTKLNKQTKSEIIIIESFSLVFFRYHLCYKIFFRVENFYALVFFRVFFQISQRASLSFLPRSTPPQTHPLLVFRCSQASDT